MDKTLIVVHRKMNRLTIILAASLLAGCASRPPVDPFAHMPDDAVSAILVGDIVCDTLEYNPKKARFDTFFRIEDPDVVAKLTRLMKGVKSELGFPFIGVLSYQRFVNARGRPIAETHIVNFNNTVVVSDPFDPVNGFYAVVRSEEFCRAIYDLMLTHCPERIEQQRKMYREVNRKLETLLFEGKDINESAQQDESTVPVKAAPSASSTAR